MNLISARGAISGGIVEALLIEMAGGEIKAIRLRSVHVRKLRDELSGGEIPLEFGASTIVVRVCVHVCVCMYVCVCVCICVHMCACVYLRSFVRVCKRTLS
jgi:hypothetical protein